MDEVVARGPAQVEPDAGVAYEWGAFALSCVLGGCVGWWAVAGPLAPYVETVTKVAVASARERGVAPLVYAFSGAWVALPATMAVNGVASVLLVPFRTTSRSLPERFRALLGTAARSALLLGLAAAVLAYACHLLADKGMDPRMVGPWVDSLGGADTLYDDPSRVVPGVCLILSAGLGQCGLILALALPGAAGNLLVRRSGGKLPRPVRGRTRRGVTS